MEITKTGASTITVPTAFAEIAAQLDPINKPAKVTEVTGIPVNTLNDWRTKGVNLRFMKIHGRIFYKRDDILEFLDRATFGSTAEAKAFDRKVAE
ncbi:helix-turn-helix domain-containing protein [Bifidobacterium saguinibicoloris]|uniref:helix-turn-helix domain-containing protein n=1 Tax=Bifidobacterium saguinibicoloris TaxID=2834433 RepID=UPI001C5A3C8D|nr:helix-turn-helix domain-containing protein [Bifidobacterium saguinibicoloris]MBW3080902.1 helix-turn-helix domain-containing protein [Bifidobacterium saguinibicoloris]